MEDAIRDLEAGTRPSEEIRHLHDEVERLRGETAKLRERLDRLAAQAAAPRRPARRPAPARQEQAPPPRHPPHARLAPGAPLAARPLSLTLSPLRGARGPDICISLSRLRERASAEIAADYVFSSATMSRAMSRARGSSPFGIEIAPTTGWPPPP